MNKKFIYVFLVVGIPIFLSCFSFSDDIIISPAAFQGTTWLDDYTFVGQLFHSESSVHKDSTTGDIIAPVHFPNDASGKRIYKIYVSYWNSCSNVIEVRLKKVNLYTNQAVTVGDVSSSSFPQNAWRIMKKGGNAMSYKTIDNTRYAWYLSVNFGCAGGSQKLGPIRIVYY